jgi:hypothetical protein
MDRGFVRLRMRALPGLDLRSAREDPPSTPSGRPAAAQGLGVGRRGLLLSAPHGQKTARRPCGPSRSRTRLYVLDFGRRRGGLAAALFPASPAPGLVRGVLESLDWIPRDAWRSWRCFDLSFETPPGAALTRASFRPGVFRIAFTLGSTSFVVARLPPADELLEARTSNLAVPPGSGANTDRAERRGRRPQPGPLQPPRPRAGAAQSPVPAADCLAGGASRRGRKQILMHTQRVRPRPRPGLEASSRPCNRLNQNRRPRGRPVPVPASASRSRTRAGAHHPPAPCVPGSSARCRPAGRAHAYLEVGRRAPSSGSASWRASVATWPARGRTLLLSPAERSRPWRFFVKQWTARDYRAAMMGNHRSYRPIRRVRSLKKTSDAMTSGRFSARILAQHLGRSVGGFAVDHDQLDAVGVAPRVVIVAASRTCPAGAPPRYNGPLRPPARKAGLATRSRHRAAALS